MPKQKSNPAKAISTEILINARPEKIWSILADFDNYQNWNPFIRSITGQVEVGKKIAVRIEPPGAKGMSFKPEVLFFEPRKRLVWLGHLLFPGLFDGEHTLELVENENGSTTFRQSETFRGIMVPLFARMLDNNTTEGFKLMNQRLKELAEKP